jgi:hypothetical protein
VVYLGDLASFLMAPLLGRRTNFGDGGDTGFLLWPNIFLLAR